MNAIIYWTVPDRSFDAPSVLSNGDIAQFSTGARPLLCTVEPNDVLTACLVRRQRDERVTIPEALTTPEKVRVLTFLSRGGAVAVLTDGRVIEVGLHNLRLLPEGA